MRMKESMTRAVAGNKTQRTPKVRAPRLKLEDEKGEVRYLILIFEFTMRTWSSQLVVSLCSPRSGSTTEMPRLSSVWISFIVAGKNKGSY